MLGIFSGTLNALPFLSNLSLWFSSVITSRNGGVLLSDVSVKKKLLVQTGATNH